MKMWKICLAVLLFFTCQQVNSQSSSSILQKSNQEAKQNYLSKKYKLKSQELIPGNRYEGPEVKAIIQLPKKWEGSFRAFEPDFSKMFWVYASDARDECYVFIQGNIIDPANNSIETPVKTFIQQHTNTLDLEPWKEGEMDLEIDASFKNYVKVSVDINCSLDGKKGKAKIYSISNDEFALVNCMCAPVKEMESKQELLATIAESFTLDASSAFQWRDPRSPNNMAMLKEDKETRNDNKKQQTKNPVDQKVNNKKKTKQFTNVSLAKISESGSSFILQTTGKTQSNAVKAGCAAIQSAHDYFDTTPQISGGIGTDTNNEAHLFFTAKKNGINYNGFALSAPLKGQKAQTVTLFCDKASRFQQSLPQMLDEFNRIEEPVSGDKPLQVSDFQWQWYESNQNKIKLPTGWQITYSEKGMILGSGDQGSFMFGFQAPIRYPGPFNQGRQQNNLLVTDNYHSPVMAYSQVYPKLLVSWLKFHGATTSPPRMTVIDHSPAPFYPGGEAAYIHSKVSSQTSNSEELTLVVTSPAGGQSAWMYYCSGIAAPVRKLQKNLPILLEIWNSWEINPQVFQERINQALRDMNIATNTMQSTINERNKSVYNSALRWDEYFRGYGHILDTENDRLYEIDLHKLEDTAEAWNDAVGTNRFRPIDPSEYWEY